MSQSDRYMGRRWRRARARAGACAAALTACGMVLSACGGGSGSTADAAAAPEEFAIGVAAAVHTLDPDQSIQQEQLQILNLIGGTLVAFNENYTGVVPALASKYEVSTDGLTYTFHLNRDAKFSDGTALTSKDVVASLQRQMKDKANANAGVVSNWAAVSAPDDATVLLTLKQAQPSVLSLLADPEIGTIVPAAHINDKKFFLKPTSAGQYKVDSFDPTNGNTTLSINQHYLGDPPAVPKIKFTFIENPNTRMVQLRAGNIDLAENLPANSISQLTGKVDGSIVQGYGGIFLLASNKDDVTGNTAVRQAISLAVDRKQISDVVWSSKAQPLYGFWPTISQASKNVLPTSVDVDRAKALLAGTPCENGCTITLSIGPGTSTNEDMATIITSNLAKIGIKVQVKFVDGATLGDMMGAVKYQLALSNLYDYVDRPDILLSYGLQSDGGIQALFSGYHSPQMDALIKKVTAEGGQQREADENAINELYAHDLPYVPLVNWVFVNGVNTSLDSWVTFQPTGWLRVATVTK